MRHNMRQYRKDLHPAWRALGVTDQRRGRCTGCWSQQHSPLGGQPETFGSRPSQYHLARRPVQRRRRRHRLHLDQRISKRHHIVFQVGHTSWSRVVRSCRKETTGGLLERKVLGLHSRRHLMVVSIRPRCGNFCYTAPNLFRNKRLGYFHFFPVHDTHKNDLRCHWLGENVE